VRKTVAVRVLQTAIDAGAGAELFIDRLPETFFILHCKDPPLRGRNRDHQIFPAALPITVRGVKPNLTGSPTPVIILIYVVARIVVALKKGDVTLSTWIGCVSSRPLSEIDTGIGVARAKTAAGELPPRDIKRWTARRKAAVVEAVHSGMITIEEVCRRYALSVEEFLSGHNTTQMHGVQGLEITKLQNYRYPARKRAERAQYVVTDEVNEVGGPSESNRCRAGSIRCLWDTQSRA
jgi:hypothetical protein